MVKFLTFTCKTNDIPTRTRLYLQNHTCYNLYAILTQYSDKTCHACMIYCSLSWKHFSLNTNNCHLIEQINSAIEFSDQWCYTVPRPVCHTMLQAGDAPGLFVAGFSYLDCWVAVSVPAAQCIPSGVGCCSVVGIVGSHLIKLCTKPYVYYLNILLSSNRSL